MDIEPRTELLKIWKAAARVSFKHGAWTYEGRRDTNSISDAEQLLCFMLPATQLADFNVAQPEKTNDEVRKRLRDFGSEREIPRVLVDALIGYLRRYRDASGTPTYGGGAAFDVTAGGTPGTPEQVRFDVVEGFVVSAQLALAALTFRKLILQTPGQSPEMEEKLEEIQALAGDRLTGAMVGLLRSFVISVFARDSDFGKLLLRTANQGRRAEEVVFDQLTAALSDVKARLKSLDIGNQIPSGFDDKDNLFEVGWTWGIAADSPKVPKVERLSEEQQRDGYALASPFLYFTIVALDGIVDLDSDLTRRHTLLTNEQLDLANALKLRWELTQKYWATVATFGVGNRLWPLEDIPWKATDGQESDLFSLMVTSISSRDLAEKRAADVDLDRLGRVLEELANRGRVTRRPADGDSANFLHSPGVQLTLAGSELDEDHPETMLTWVLTDFATSLLKRTLALADLMNDVTTRRRLLRLADRVWSHLNDRRMESTDVGAEMWDKPSRVFGGDPYTKVSWHHTLRVIEALIIAATMSGKPPLRSPRLHDLAEELLAEAEHLLDSEVLRPSGGVSGRAIGELRSYVRRARLVVEERPGSALSLAVHVLSELESFVDARERTNEGPQG